MSLTVYTSWCTSRFDSIVSLDALPVCSRHCLRADISATVADAGADHSIDDLDALAVSLRSAVESIDVPLARAARAFVEREVWKSAGFANVNCHARERLDRSGKWVRELARLAVALERFPALVHALRAIGRTRSQTIATLLDDANVDAWIERARTLSVRELRNAIGETKWDARVDRDAIEGRSQITVLAWPAVKHAFDEMIDVGRCTTGHDATVASVVDAMLAENDVSDEPQRDAAPGAGIDAVPLKHVTESALKRVTAHWTELRRADLSRAGRHAVETLETIARLSAVDPMSLSDCDLERHLARLIGIEDQVERRIGDLLVEMSERGAWSRLMFNGLGQYAEERLGMARTSAEDRAFVARAMRRFPLLRAAYGDGRLSFEKALIVVRVLGRAPADRTVERAWLVRARECTVKRLRDEARALGRVNSREPLGDEAWLASIRREAGDARVRVMQAGLDVLRAIERGERPDVFLRLRLPESLSTRLMTAIEARRRVIEHEVAALPWDEPWPADDARPAVRAARELHVRARRVPACLGLLSLIEDAVAAWDPVRKADPPHGRRIHGRAGWRCEAPGCTNRDRLEWHHIVRVSAGGSSDDANGLSLCWTHHHEGEHGGLTRAEGTAPLDVTWRVGVGSFVRWYRNEREVPPDA